MCLLCLLAAGDVDEFVHLFRMCAHKCTRQQECRSGGAEQAATRCAADWPRRAKAVVTCVVYWHWRVRMLPMLTFTESYFKFQPSDRCMCNVFMLKCYLFNKELNIG